LALRTDGIAGAGEPEHRDGDRGGSRESAPGGPGGIGSVSERQARALAHGASHSLPPMAGRSTRSRSPKLQPHPRARTAPPARGGRGVPPPHAGSSPDPRPAGPPAPGEGTRPRPPPPRPRP